MARNQHAVIWTRVSGQPEKMGDLLLSGDQAAFTYTRDYLSSERWPMAGSGATIRSTTRSVSASRCFPVCCR